MIPFYLSLTLRPQFTPPPPPAALHSPNFKCTLPGAPSSSIHASGTGALSLTADGGALSLLCFDAGVGSALAPSKRVIALISADGTVDTRTRCTDCFTGNSSAGRVNLVGATTFNASGAGGFFIGGTSTSVDVSAGVRWIAWGGARSAPVSTSSTTSLSVLQVVPVNAATMQVCVCDCDTSI